MDKSVLKCVVEVRLVVVFASAVCEGGDSMTDVVLAAVVTTKAESKLEEMVSTIGMTVAGIEETRRVEDGEVGGTEASADESASEMEMHCCTNPAPHRP